MRLQRLDIRGFGQLRGSIPLETGENSLALLLERNEAGKSTLAAAVLAALYGVQSDRRRSRHEKVEKDRYRPWDGQGYGLALTLEAGGEELVIDRDLERGGVRVLRGSEDVTDRYQRGATLAVGEILTGLTRDQFTLSTFVGQGDIIWSDAQGLTEALQRVADSQAGTATAATAVAALAQALDRYDGITLRGPGKVATEIQRCEERIAADRETLQLLEAEKEALADRIGALSDHERARRVHALHRDVLRVRRLQREGDALEALLESDAQDAERLRAARAQLDADPTWELFTPTVLEDLHATQRELEMSRRMIQRAEAEMEDAESARRLAVEALDREKLARRPLKRDADLLRRVHERLREARERRTLREAEMRREEQALRDRGTTPERARLLASAFHAIAEEDRDLLSGRTQESARREETRNQLEGEVADRRRTLAEVDTARGGRRRTGWILAVVGVALGAAGFAFADRLPWNLPSPVELVPGAAVLLGGVAALAGAGRVRRRDEIEARQRMGLVENGLRELVDEEALADHRWGELAGRLNVPKEELAERYDEYRRVATHVDALGLLTERVNETLQDEARAVEALAEVDDLFEAPAADVDQIADRIDRVDTALELHDHVDQAMALADARRRRLDEQRAARERHEAKLREQLDETGLDFPANATVASLLQRVDEGEDRAQQLRSVRDELVPDLERRVLGEEQRAAEEERLQQVHAERDRLRRSVEADLPLLGQKADPVRQSLEKPLTQAEYDHALRALDDREEESRRQGEEERTSARAFLQRYELEAPPLRESIARHERALRKAEQFRDAVELARTTLDQISRETHRHWAAALNRHANEVLQALGSRVESLHFDENLGLRMAQNGQVLTGRDAVQHLSAGAADAVYLAARIAVSRFLSGGKEVLPLILDDPFANADDERLLSAGRLLLEGIATQQQVLLMACQHSRYEWLRRELGYPSQLVVLGVEGNAARSQAESGTVQEPHDPHRQP